MRIDVLVLLFSTLCMPLWAAAEPLRLVTGDGYAPFTGKALPGGGLLSQVVQTAFSQGRASSTLDWRPWNRGLRMTLEAQYDATFPYMRSQVMEQDYLFSNPLLVVRAQLFSRAGEVYEVDDLPALAGKRLCYPLGWQLPVAIQSMVESGLLARHAPAGLNECARLLLLQRDDFFIANGPIGAAALEATGEPASRFRRSQSAFPERSLHLIVSRRHPRAEQVLLAFNQGLAGLQAGNQYRQILNDYLQQRDQQAAR
ncbi:amino acid ABC transporter substrate-binding protein [Pseudomonas sp. SA3-5]|uniref:Amino acid ABC transporter substrate-binding protein n=1 Tax=Pseudomonas aestuarii TaxID=3018340 RepID=A0ABT4XEM7_9PSED|nr:amino acid ABC transporter substrate-binding protein [Pseudomonas aestuarii]MDA7086666.1 amino acid ABC transporter substrate-binding protein [Pseudomonas aestuarii]